MKKILMIVTSHKEMINTNKKTGLWLGELTDPYYAFVDAGYEVSIASPKGGVPPIDPLSKLVENITASNRRFLKDDMAQKKFNSTYPLVDVEAKDFEALYIPGGHGPLWDLATDEVSGKLILDFFNNQKSVASVCHGPAALIKAAEMQPNLLKGKRMTSFTNLEETLVFRQNNIPYQLETRLKELGADFHSSVIPYGIHVETDGLLITGQNPLSAKPVAKAQIELLKSRKKITD